MNKKLVILFEILFVVVAFGYYIITIMIPEYREKYGSSDKLFSFNKYNSMYEFLYEDGTNFSIVLDDDKKIYHIFFFDKNSLSIYNHKIEGMKIEDGLSAISDILGDRSLLKVICYDGDLISKYINNTSVVYTKSTIEEKCRELSINVNEHEEMLSDMDFYSKEIIKYYKSDKSRKYREYSDSIYMKIEEYIFANNISNLDKNSTDLLIQSIPTDNGLYPSVNSWYYVEDGKIYAYIEFDDFGFCYRGAVDSVIEGMCLSSE